MPECAVSILAHPDDAEFLCAGVLTRLARERNWQIHIATMTPGDCGSAERSREEISLIRKAEGAAAAALLAGQYHCLEESDLLIFYSENTLEKVTRLLRQVKPRMVFTHSPRDYMLDHEVTSTIVRAAVFGAPIPNFLDDRLTEPPLQSMPHLYYCDPIEGKDALGHEIRPGFYVDITKAIETKKAMLECHASQREWLMKHHGMDQYVTAMREWAAARGRQCGVRYAEGFRQHLGHGYPQENLLTGILSEQAVLD